jgi:hypothetical protein
MQVSTKKVFNLTFFQVGITKKKDTQFSKKALNNLFEYKKIAVLDKGFEPLQIWQIIKHSNIT